MKFVQVYLLLVCLFIWEHSSAQKIEESKVYYAINNEEVKISLGSNGPQVSHTILQKKFFNVNADPYLTEEYIFDRSFSEVKNIKATYGLPFGDKGKFTVNRTSNISKQTNFSRGVFYDDNTYNQIEYPRVLAGGYTELEYQIELEDPHFIKDFYFTEDYGVKSSTYSVIVDPGVNIDWKVFGEQKDQLEFSEVTLKKGEKKYSWTLKDIQPYQGEKGSPGYLFYGTHIVLRIKNYTQDGKTQNVLGSVEDLFTWYQSFIEQIPPSNDSIIQNITKSLIKNTDNDFEKARNIYNWVQDNIRYIAFEDGWRGFIPYPAQQICDKKYGDCKDMAHLLYTMFKIANLPAKHAWVGTRDLPYRYEESPDPGVDNHMIVFLEIGDSTILLDATDSYSPFGYPTSFILSKEVLTTNKDGNYRIYKVPEFKPENCIISDSIYAEINENAIIGKGSKYIESFEYSYFQHNYSASNSSTKEFLEGYLELGLQNFELMDWKVSQIVPRSKLKIDYEYDIHRQVVNYENSKFVNLNLSRPFSSSLLSEKRTQSFEIEYKRKYEFHLTFKIPENKRIAHLPEDIESTFSVGSISAKYSQNGNTILYDRIILIDRLLIEPAEFSEWNNFIKALLKVYNSAIEFN